MFSIHQLEVWVEGSTEVVMRRVPLLPLALRQLEQVVVVHRMCAFEEIDASWLLAVAVAIVQLTL